MSDWLSDLLSNLPSDVASAAFTGRTGGRRADRIAARQLAAFDRGKVVRVRCRFRAPTSRRSRPGTLRLSRGHATWTHRYRRTPLLTVNRREAVPIDTTMRGRSVVLNYDKGQFRICRRDLAITGRVLDLPPFAGH